MRKVLFYTLTMCLAALVAARACLPSSAEALEAEGSGYGYNMLETDLPTAPETAGSALIAEMNGYYLSRPATEKNAYTGALAGKNLILICADGWQPDPAEEGTALYELSQGGARFSDVYRPDWYQGMDGREFALLTGIVPTNVNGETALSWLGRQEIYLPFTLARTLGAQGYACRAYIQEEKHRDAYEAMGFSEVGEYRFSAQRMVSATAEDCLSQTPFFAVYIWETNDGEEALRALLDALEEQGLSGNTALCLLTGGGEENRAQLFLRDEAVSGVSVNGPCSELDVTPTLLNLYGVDYDARFLSGRDILAPSPERAEAEDQIPLVSLYGSAYSDWVTAAGSYFASEQRFHPAAGVFSGSGAGNAYAQKVSRLVYDRYMFARRVMENNYFHLVFGQ